MIMTNRTDELKHEQRRLIRALFQAGRYPDHPINRSRRYGAP